MSLIHPTVLLEICLTNPTILGLEAAQVYLQVLLIRRIS